jgi:hypothetical protein
MSHLNNLLHRTCFRSVFFLTVLMFASFQVFAENKALRTDIEHKLIGKTLVSKVVLGCKAIPQGFQADYPTHTLVSSDGSIKYRVEFGLMRQDVGEQQITRRLESGTSLRVIGVDMKDDRLEVKFESLNGGDSAKVKLLFGNGWQSSMDANAVEQFIEKVLAGDQRSQSTTPDNAIPSSTDVVLLVHNAAEQAVPDAEVQVCHPNCEAVTTTDQEGKAQLKSIPDGALSLVILRDGFQPFKGNAGIDSTHRMFSIKLDEKLEIKACDQSSKTPQERQQWASEHGHGRIDYREYCKDKAYGTQNSSLLISCNQDGFPAMYIELTGNCMACGETPHQHPASQLAKELCSAGFIHVHLSDNYWSEEDYVITSGGAALATPENIPIEPTPEGRAEFVEMVYSQYFNRGCRWGVGGKQGEVLYFGCPELKWENVKETYASKPLAINLRARGFSTAVYGDGGDNNWIAEIAASGFQSSGAISADALFQQYGVKNQLVAAREEKELQAYKDYLYELTGKLLEYSSARSELGRHKADPMLLGRYRKAMSDETVTVANIKNSRFLQRPAFWSEFSQYASALLRGGVHEGSGTFAFTSGDPQQDEAALQKLLAEIELIKAKTMTHN